MTISIENIDKAIGGIESLLAEANNLKLTLNADVIQAHNTQLALKLISGVSDVILVTYEELRRAAIQNTTVNVISGNSHSTIKINMGDIASFTMHCALHTDSEGLEDIEIGDSSFDDINLNRELDSMDIDDIKWAILETEMEDDLFLKTLQGRDDGFEHSPDIATAPQGDTLKAIEAFA